MTDGRLSLRMGRGLTACQQRTPRGQAAGESAAGPEPPSPGRCCKLDELEPTRWNKGELESHGTPCI